MSDKEICETIIKDGDCGAFSCNGDGCPFRGTEYDCVGGDAVVKLSRQWIKDNPECAITKEELIKKCKGSAVYASSKEGKQSIINSCKSLGLMVNFTDKCGNEYNDDCAFIIGMHGTAGSLAYCKKKNISIIEYVDFVKFFPDVIQQPSEKDQSITNGKSIETIIERRSANYEYISKRNEMAGKELMCMCDGVKLASYSNNIMVIEKTEFTICQSRVLGNWLVKVTKNV